MLQGERFPNKRGELTLFLSDGLPILIIGITSKNKETYLVLSGLGRFIKRVLVNCFRYKEK